MHNGQFARVDLAASSHFIEMQQGRGPAAIADLFAAELDSVSGDVEAVQERGNVILVELPGRNRYDVVIDGAGVDSKLLGERTRP